MDCLKKKEKSERAELKKITPNNKLYLRLLLASVVLTIASLAIKDHAAAFTIWTSFSCGCIASSLIAWLVDAANCRQITRKNHENREALFANLYHVFDNGLQLLVFEVAENEHCLDSKEWYTWTDLAEKQAVAKPELIPAYIRSLMTFFDDVAEQVFAIKSQEAMLLDAGIICQEDIQALSTILTICDTSRSTFRSKECDEDCLRFFNTNCGLIRGLIGFAPSLRPINEIMVEPRLYRMYLAAEQNSHQFEGSQGCSLDDQEKHGISLGAEDEHNG